MNQNSIPAPTLLRDETAFHSEIAKPRVKVFWGFIKLKRGIEMKNYIAILFHVFVLGYVLGGTELLQQNILSDPNYYNYGPKDAMQMNSYISLWDLILKVLITPFYGALIDKIGRQKIIFYAYALITLSYLLFPIRHYTSAFDSIFWFFAFRALYSNGSAMLAVCPFIADYVFDHSKGRAMGINVPFLSIGLLTSTVVIGMLRSYDIFYSYMFSAGVTFFLGFGYGFFLKSGNSYFKQRKQVSAGGENARNIQRTSNPKRLIRNAIKSKPWVLISYIFAFVQGVGLAISAQILNLYVQSFDSEDPIKAGNTMVKISNIAAVLTSLILGISLDFISPLYVAAVCFSLGAVGYFLSWTITESSSPMMILVSISAGISYSTGQLLSNYLIFKHSPKPLRGLLFGIVNFFILISVIIVTCIGGTLFKYHDKNWPFCLGGGIMILALIAFFYLYFSNIVPWEKKHKNGAELRKSLLGDKHSPSHNSITESSSEHAHNDKVSSPQISPDDLERIEDYEKSFPRRHHRIEDDDETNNTTS